MAFSIIYQHFRSLLSLIHLLILGSPDAGLSAFIVLWIVRIITFGLLTRTYFIPWCLALASDRIRVRSISLWSIRGLYIRKGGKTLKVERVSYVWHSVNGKRRLAVKIDGLSMNVAKEEAQAKPTVRRHNRNLTLADLNPSPIAGQLWRLISVLVAFVDPYFRPVIRSYVIACLRVAIQWVPKITEALSFDLQSTVITFADIPGAKIVADNINLNTALHLEHLAEVVEAIDSSKKPGRPDTRVAHGVGVWKKRMGEAFQRSLDKALGDSHATATLSLKVANVVGSMPRTAKQGKHFQFI